MFLVIMVIQFVVMHEAPGVVARLPPGSLGRHAGQTNDI